MSLLHLSRDYQLIFIHIIFISYSSRNNCSRLKIILLLKTFFLVFTYLVQNEDLCLPRNSRCFLGQIMCFSAVFQSVRAKYLSKSNFNISQICSKIIRNNVKPETYPLKMQPTSHSLLGSSLLFLFLELTGFSSKS